MSTSAADRSSGGAGRPPAPAAPVPVVIDCDPANDDALAILVAAGDPAVRLLAVTAVAGHAVLEQTLHNAAVAVHEAGLSGIPVAGGCEAPLVRDQVLAGVLDLGMGLDAYDPSRPRAAVDERHAVDVLVEALEQEPGATVVATGPLTNVAVALRRHPRLRDLAGRVVTLGGAWGLGNKTAAAEFNVLCDPEAAAVVYASGLPLTVLPVDATARTRIDDALVARAAALRTRSAPFATELLASLQRTHRSGPGPLAQAEAALHDPCAVLVAAHGHLARTLRTRIDVETSGRLTYGRTVVDFAGRAGLEPNADVVVELDVDAVHTAFVAALAALPPARPLQVGAVA